MAITDNRAIQFCNEQIRPLADYLGRIYYLGIAIDNQWTALGEDADALAILGNDMVRLSRIIRQTISFGSGVNTDWISGVSPIFPNTTEQVFDNDDNTAPDPTRPGPLTGIKVNNIITRRTEFANWLDTGLFAGGGADAGAQRNRFIMNALGQALNLARATTTMLFVRQLRTEYEALAKAKLITILEVAVNPGGTA